MSKTVPVHLEVSGAYGRTYATAAAMRDAWQAGADFIVHDFRGDFYASVRDFPWVSIIGRYGRDGSKLATLQRVSDPVSECTRCGDMHATGQGHGRA